MDWFDLLDDPFDSIFQMQPEYPLSFYYDSHRFKEWPEVLLVKKAPYDKIPDVYALNQHTVTLPRSLKAIYLSLGILTSGEDVYVVSMEPVAEEKWIHIGLNNLMNVKMFIEVCSKIYPYFFSILFLKHHETYIFYPFVSEFFAETNRKLIRKSTHLPHMVLSMGSLNRCPLCLIDFNSDINVPLILKCNCTICKPCLSIIITSDKETFITCPSCDNKETPKVDLSQLIINHLFYF
jgi:hypothetical protein